MLNHGAYNHYLSTLANGLDMGWLKGDRLHFDTTRTTEPCEGEMIDHKALPVKTMVSWFRVYEKGVNCYTLGENSSKELLLDPLAWRPPRSCMLECFCIQQRVLCPSA